MNLKKHFLFIFGATGSGKTALSFSLARELGASVLNGDSIQSYRELTIGSAKPSPQETAQVPTYLFDFVYPPNAITAADFFRESLEVIHQLEHEPVTILSGGSAFYLNALENGLSSWPEANTETQNSLRQEIVDKGAEVLWQELQKLEPQLARKISPNDHYRLVRYLEVARATGGQAFERLSQTTGGLKDRGQILKFGIFWERETLKLRLSLRMEEMFERGWMSEVETLLQRGYENWWPLKSVGYAEIVSFLKAQTAGSVGSLKDLKAQIVTANMQLAKKQMTWWRRDPSIIWLKGEEGTERIYQEALGHVQKKLYTF